MSVTVVQVTAVDSMAVPGHGPYPPPLHFWELIVKDAPPNTMSRFASNSDTRLKARANGGTQKSTPTSEWRPNVNATLSTTTKIREGARTYVAVSRVTGGEAPTCSGHVDIARGKVFNAVGGRV